MEENKNQEELKLILEELKKVLELYNKLNPRENLTLAKQEEKKNVSDIFICVYNNKHVGLFKKINWSSDKKISSTLMTEYAAGSTYIGVDSIYLGIKTTHRLSESVNQWEPIGTKIIVDGKSHVANCEIQSEMSFDDMRLIMYNKGQIEPYEIGKASSKEMIDVLNFAYNYYQLDKNIKKQKTK